MIHSRTGPEFSPSKLIENQNGRPWFTAQRQAEQRHPIEAVGSRLRGMMPFLNPVTSRPDEQS